MPSSSANSPWNTAYFYVQIAALAVGSVMFLLFLQVPANPYVAFALTGSAIGYVASDRHWLRLVTLLLASCAYFLIYQLGRGLFDHYPAWWIAEPGGFVGLSAVVLSMLRWFRAPSDANAKRGVTMQAAIPALCSISVLVVGAAMRLTPLTYDYTLYAFDRSLGSPGVLVAKWFATHPPMFFAISAAVYNMLPLWISLTWMGLIVQGGEQSYQRRVALIALGVIGFGLYQLCPAAGPAYRFAGVFPFTSPDPASLPSGATFLETGARNAMPSLHISWTLIIMVCTLGWHWTLRVAAVVISVLTLLAMLGSGEHYFIDAVVALPLVAGVLAGAARSLPRVLRLTICAGSSIITVAWLLAFRAGAALALTDGGRVLATTAAAVVGTASIGVLAWLFRVKSTAPTMLEQVSIPQITSQAQTR
jgi:hypothetical protein